MVRGASFLRVAEDGQMRFGGHGDLVFPACAQVMQAAFLPLAGWRRDERPPEKRGSRGGGPGRGLVGFLWGTPEAFAGSRSWPFSDFGLRLAG